jgi:protein N-terminal amidase
MALSGYIFPTPASVRPYLEPPRIGPTSLLCRKLAKKLGCCVVAGYPEVLPDSDAEAESSGSFGGASTSATASASAVTGQSDGGADLDIKGEALGVGYNSAMVVDKTGEVVGNYRKTFRFDTDKNWAREGGSGLLLNKQKKRWS